jgi:hypothetical protein
MGVDDLMAARNMVMAAMKTTELKRIDYQTFNSLQKVGDTAMEARYNTLLQRVGSTVSFDPDLVNIPLCFFSIILNLNAENQNSFYYFAIYEPF